MQRLSKQPTFKINNEAQLTNAFIKLVQAEIYTLEFRVKHESQNISDKKALKLRRQLISEFKNKVINLSQNYLEQKANLHTCELMNQKEMISQFLPQLVGQDIFNQQLTFNFNWASNKGLEFGVQTPC